MDSPGGSSSFRQASNFGRISAANVSRLDKIDAIPSKISNENVLIDGLCQEDQIYLNALLENSDSSDQEDDEEKGSQSLRSSAWSPMMQNPVLMKKRIKLLKTHYAVTLSLEDISYIRPSWGLSKGPKRIGISKKKKKKRSSPTTSTSQSIPGDQEISSSKIKNDMLATERLVYYLILLVVAVIILMLPPYLVDKHRDYMKTETNRLQIDPLRRVIEIYRPTTEELISIFKIRYGLNVPLDLRPEECDCDIFDVNGRQPVVYENLKCFACYDWAFRANLRVYVEKKDEASEEKGFCYHIKWQNYNTLFGPLVDCLMLEDEQWFGLGDIRNLSMPFNRLEFDWRPLKSNLSVDSLLEIGKPEKFDDNIGFGSYVNLTLFSSNRIFLGNLETDFEILMNLTKDAVTGGKQLCLSATCTDKCTETWLRDDHLEQLRFKNSFFEYTVCSGRSLKDLISKQIIKSTSSLSAQVSENFQLRASTTTNNQDRSFSSGRGNKELNSTNNEPGLASTIQNKTPLKDTTITVKQNLSSGSFPEGIGLIDRLVFTTSTEFLPVLDGQTVRDYVDTIVNLDLKSSVILALDTRWQSYLGSLRLNSFMFPKAKLLLEIFHNRGFKIIFTVKPYLDTKIGLETIQDLIKSDRLYPTNFVDHRLLRKSDPRAVEVDSLNLHRLETLSRRVSFFKYKNFTLRFKSRDIEKFPLLFNCKESTQGFCGLIELTNEWNRRDLVHSIKRTDLLTFGADGIKIGGTHPNGFAWQDHYRESLSRLTRDLFYREKLYTIPQYTGDFGYIELAPRSFTWQSLKSILNSIFNLGMMGFSLINPGSVWGDLKISNKQTDIKSTSLAIPNPRENINPIYTQDANSESSEKELAIRWLQLYVFLPILQFNNLNPIERFGLYEQMRNLIKIRKAIIVPELKSNLPFTPLISSTFQQLNSSRPKIVDPLIKPVWLSQESRDLMIAEQFMIGNDILVAPILSDGQRQRDIYLPSGFWRDELRQTGVRGGKWLRNYRVELNEVAWFSKDKR